MKVWRVEDINGVGLHSKLVAPHDEEYDLIAPTAFNLAVYSDWCPYDDDLGAHPPPDKDISLQRHLAEANAEVRDYLFAFSSPQQMRSYLYRDSWVLKLDEFDMYVAVYWVDSGVVAGDYQVLIPKGLAPLERYRIGYYFGLSKEERP